MIVCCYFNEKQVYNSFTDLLKEMITADFKDAKKR